MYHLPVATDRKASIRIQGDGPRLFPWPIAFCQPSWLIRKAMLPCSAACFWQVLRRRRRHSRGRCIFWQSIQRCFLGAARRRYELLRSGAKLRTIKTFECHKWSILISNAENHVEEILWGTTFLAKPGSDDHPIWKCRRCASRSIVVSTRCARCDALLALRNVVFLFPPLLSMQYRVLAAYSSV